MNYKEWRKQAKSDADHHLDETQGFEITPFERNLARHVLRAVAELEAKEAELTGYAESQEILNKEAWRQAHKIMGLNKENERLKIRLADKRVEAALEDEDV